MSEPVVFNHREKVRVVGMKTGSPDEFAIVNTTGIRYNDNGEQIVWITNMNMPYCGNISAFVTLDKIERIRK